MIPRSILPPSGRSRRSFRYWLDVLQALNFRERFLVGLIAFVVVGATAYWGFALYVNATRPIPETGGTYVEGLVGQPLYVNPLLASNNAADADLSRLVYAGLFSYAPSGSLDKQLAADYSVSEDGKRYEVKIRPGLTWHDGEPLTADDVVYTFQTLQNPAYRSPLRGDWQGVEVSASAPDAVVFVLRKPYFGFLENLTTGILPKHIWENISPEKFALTEYNLMPVGSGPYRYTELNKNSSGDILTYELRPFEGYALGEPFVSRLVFHFYASEDELLEAYRRKEVIGMGAIAPETLRSLSGEQSLGVHQFSQPRLFAVFFNETKSVPLAYPEVRRALSLAVDRRSLVDQVLDGYGVQAGSPFLPGMVGYRDEQGTRFDVGEAERILEEAGWKKGDDGFRGKNGQALAFDMVTPEWPHLVRTADLLASQWQVIGVKVNIKALGMAELQQAHIRPREYQALLYGIATRFNPDPYSFWHSGQKEDPGGNLSMFDDKTADDLLSSARETLDDNARRDKYFQFQDILLKEAPAAFLYAPTYIYAVKNTVKGIGEVRLNTPSDRFADILHWYINTQRIRK